MELIIRITDEEAEHLSHTTTCCFYHEQPFRFDYVNKSDEQNNIMNTFDLSNIMHFYDNIVNAILAKNYFVAKGFKCVLLHGEHQMEYVIATNQSWKEYIKKDTTNQKDTNNEYSDGTIDISI